MITNLNGFNVKQLKELINKHTLGKDIGSKEKLIKVIRDSDKWKEIRKTEEQAIKVVSEKQKIARENFKNMVKSRSKKKVEVVEAKVVEAKVVEAKVEIVEEKTEVLPSRSAVTDLPNQFKALADELQKENEVLRKVVELSIKSMKNLKF